MINEKENPSIEEKKIEKESDKELKEETIEESILNHEETEEKEELTEDEVLKNEEELPVDDSRNVRTPEEIAKLPFAQKVEATRKTFIQKYRKIKLINNIVLFASLAVVVGGMIGIMSIKVSWAVWVAVAIAAVVLVAVFIYSKLSRKKMEEMTKGYVSFIFNAFNEYTFDDKCFSNTVADDKEMFTVDDFNNALIYKDITSVRGRNMVHSTAYHTDFQVQELVGNITNMVKKRSKSVPLFVGKFIIAKNNVNVTNRIIIYLKGKSELVSTPTGIDDLPVVLDNDIFAVFAEGDGWKHIVTKELIAEVKKLKVNKVLLDATFSIRSGKTYVTINYDDILMVLPFQNQYDVAPMKEYKKNIEVVAKILDLLS